jgi:eukaryotic-like serine/threonine-protein kinase
MAEFSLLPEGTVVAGRYRVCGVLGQGGMGAVYRVDDAETGHAVALKTLREDLYERDDLVKRFEREAQAASRIGHPNIVRIHGFGNDERLRTRFIVQELLHGTDVSGCLNELGNLSSLSTLAVAMPVMDALVAAHAVGIVHRDIKPENVFLHETDEGVVVPKAIDFGIAKVIDGLDLDARTATGMVFGTPWYMSPEQALGDSSIDARTDIWSVGTMLYEMLCGTLPFGGSNPNAVMAQIIYGRPTPLKDNLPDVAPDLAAVVHRAIERELDRRYRTMAEFRDALAGCSLWRGVTPELALGFMPRPSAFEGINDILPAEFLDDAEERLGARRSRQASRRGFTAEFFEPRAIAPSALPAPEVPAEPAAAAPEDEPRARSAGDEVGPGDAHTPDAAPTTAAVAGHDLPHRQPPQGFLAPPTEPPPTSWTRARWVVVALVLLALGAAVALAATRSRHAAATRAVVRAGPHGAIVEGPPLRARPRGRV